MGNIYLAPLEGITGFVFRQAYHTCINPGIDKYFTPFISPNQNRCMSGREKRDILPENNQGIHLVPQILTRDPERFTATARELREYGYNEVNLNLGCPSPTVTTKKKGAAMLADLNELERFLDGIFTDPPVEISIKTRLGIEKEEEWEPLIELFNQYPVKELIVHARLLKDFYGGTPRREAFHLAAEKSRHPLCYNGDIFTLENYLQLQQEAGAAAREGMLRCSEAPREGDGLQADAGDRNVMLQTGTGDMNVMLGRGILFHPELSVQIMESQSGTGASMKCAGKQSYSEPAAQIMKDAGNKTIHQPDFWAFHEQLLTGYERELSGDGQVIQKMKELWSYMIAGFPNSEKTLKKIKKAKNLQEYRAAVAQLYSF